MINQNEKVKFDLRHKSSIFPGAIIIASVLLTGCGSGSSDPTQNTSPDTSSPAETDPSADSDSNTDSTTDTDSSTNSDANPADETPTDDDSDANNASTDENEIIINTGPPAPVDLIGVVYTESELEVFWKAPSGSNGITYNIIVNGELLDTVDARSYYMNDLAPATTFNIDVQSIDNAGTKGQTASISLTTREAGATITTGNAINILNYVVSIANEEPLAEFVDILNATNGPSWYEEGIERSDPTTALPLGLEFTGFEVVDEYTKDLNYNCVAGGTARQSSVFGAQYSARGMSFADCRSNLTNEQQLDGAISSYWELIKFVGNPGSSGSNSFSNLTITADDGRQRILNGGLSKHPRTNSTHSWSGGSSEKPFYIKQAFEGQTTISEMRVLRRDSTSDSNVPTLTATFQVQAPETGNKLIKIETVSEFTANCSQGELNITAMDGSSMSINAANDDVSSFNLTINSEGVVMTLEVEWDESNTFKQLLDNGDMNLDDISCV